VLLIGLFLLQSTATAVADTNSVYSTLPLQQFITEAARSNRVPPLELKGYTAHVESELALILRDSLGRELVGQLEQLAARAEWDRGGRYELHVVGFRAQSAGAPYSALSWTRMYTVPTLYGSRLVLGVNDGVTYDRRDSSFFKKRVERDRKDGLDTLRAIHPLAVDREKYYEYTGGDTVATLYSNGRAIRIVRVHVKPVRRPRSNFVAYVGELDFDADRHQLVRMRGRLVQISMPRRGLVATTTGAMAAAYLEFENAEVNGKYWLPTYQRSEFQAQMALLGDTRPIYRVVSRFSNFSLRTDTVVTLSEMDSVPPRLRSKLTFASKDSVSQFGKWDATLGSASGQVDGDDFDDLAPDRWKPTGKPRVDYWPKHFDEVVRYNRVEGMFTGVGGQVRFRDAMPGLSAHGSIGAAWEEQTFRGSATLALSRGHWIQSLRAERTLENTNDFRQSLDNGLGIGPLIGGVDDNDYLDRRVAAYSVSRIIKNVDKAVLGVEVAYVEDRNEVSRLKNGVFGSTAFRPNRNAMPGRYTRAIATLEFHPSVNGESLSPGVGALFRYQVASGDLNWQQLDARLAMRQYWRGLVLTSAVSGGAVFGSVLPPQAMYEMGGAMDLPSYSYKEFGGDRAALGSGLIAYYFPIWRTPWRIGPITIPGLSPGIGSGVSGGWAEASSPAARAALLALGGDGITPLSRPTGKIRGTMDYRFTLLSGALGVGIARAIDHPDRWKPYFGFGLNF
jgi:hypothetical protein